MDKYNQQSYKFNMRSKVPEQPASRRTSERRRLKMLKNNNEYKMSNPYRSHKQPTPLPDELSHQLKRLQYLSATTISMLSFQSSSQKDPNCQNTLLKMKLAGMEQEQKYGILYGNQQETNVENPEEEYGVSLSEEVEGGHEERDEVITTREELSMHMIPFHPVFMDCREIDEEGLNLMESSPPLESLSHHGMPRNDHTFILDTEFEHYFAA